MLVEVWIECESFALKALPDGLELFLVLEFHPVQRVVEQRGSLNFIESAEFTEHLHLLRLGAWSIVETKRASSRITWFPDYS